jgi:mycofactocin glycosyltransferase
VGWVMTRPPTISVVVPCYRHAEELEHCLTGLALQQCEARWEVVVVDSASDREVAAAAAAGGARLVQSPTRLLPGQARNAGAVHARGDLLAFIDADCVPDPGWLSAACAAMDGNVRLASGPILDSRPLHPIAVSDNLLQFADFPRNRPEGPARYFPGCNLAIQRSDFFAIGGFPEVTLPAGEDTSFCNIVEARWPGSLRFTPGMRVRHAGRTRFAAYLQHHSTFGYCRAALDLHLKPSHRRWAGYPLMGIPVAAKRLGYILGRGWEWDARQLFKTLILLPVVLAGLIAWSSGFRRGLRAGGVDR